MPQKKEKETKKTQIEENRETTKRAKKNTKKINNKIQEGEIISYNKNINYKKYIKATEIILLIINMVAIIILNNKINKINDWTLLYNGGIENYKNLKTVYNSTEYKQYILNEINDLKLQLNNIKQNQQ